jgi:homer
LHSYKEENQRYKQRHQELENSKAASGNHDASDDLRREITLLKSRIESLEKEMMNQEIELKVANKNLKDKNNDPTVSFNVHMGG